MSSFSLPPQTDCYRSCFRDKIRCHSLDRTPSGLTTDRWLLLISLIFRHLGLSERYSNVVTVKRWDLPCQRHRDLQFLMQNLDPQFHAFLAAILHRLVPNITKDKEKDVPQDPKSGSSPQNNDSPPTPTP